MNARKKRLGRGLDALLSKPAEEAGAAAAATAESPTDAGSGVTEAARSPAPPDGALRDLPVEQLRRGEYQPRVDMRQESLAELADSIRSQGIVQPIVVRPVPADGVVRFEIIAGERRWRAAQQAGLATIPAVVRDIEDEDAIAMALIENIQRENLNPLEESRALTRLIGEFDLTHAEAATAVGRSRAAVSNLLRLQDLTDKVKSLVEDRSIDMGHARALLAIQDPVQQFDAARQVARQDLSVRATERLVKNMLAGKTGKPPAQREASADIRRLETDLADRLGARVRIDHGPKGGKLVITYNSLDELDGILEHIK
jgi:ParB family chromosome partitioning protein